MAQKVRPDAKSQKGACGFISAGVEIYGRIEFKGALRIEGILRGDVEGKGTLFVGKGAFLESNIKAANVVVAGSVVGSIFASNVELLTGGKVTGDIRSPNLKIGKGAVFDGSSFMDALVPSNPLIANKDDDDNVLVL